MIVKICDRCKAVIPDRPDYMQGQLSVFSIRYLSEREINLCNDCEIELKKWLNPDNEKSKVQITNGREEYRFIEAGEIPSLKGSDWKVIVGDGTCFIPQ